MPLQKNMQYWMRCLIQNLYYYLLFSKTRFVPLLGKVISSFHSLRDKNIVYLLYLQGFSLCTFFVKLERNLLADYTFHSPDPAFCTWIFAVISSDAAAGCTNWLMFYRQEYVWLNVRLYIYIEILSFTFSVPFSMMQAF